MAINPFEPYNLASPGTYKGRERELVQIHAITTATSEQNARHFIVSGSRGSGKSSLIKAARDQAKPLNLVAAYCPIDASTTTRDLFEQIASVISLERENLFIDAKREYVETAKEHVASIVERLKSIQRFKAVGFEVDLGKAPELRDFPTESIIGVAYALCGIVDDLAKLSESLEKPKIRGLLLLLDEADMADPEKLQLGKTIKILTEVLDLRGRKNISIGLSGLPNLYNNLLRSHRSSLRAFEKIALTELSNNDLHQILEACCHSTIECAVTLSSGAADRLVALSEGLAHWLRHFASKAYEVASMRSPIKVTIGIDDVESSEIAAIREIGDIYFKHDFDLLSQTEQDLVFALSGTRKEESDIARISAIVGREMSEDQIFDICRSLSDVDILAPVRFKGSKAYVDFSSDIYRRWVEISLGERRSRSILPHLDKVLEDIQNKGGSGVILIRGEDQAAFRDFSALMKVDTFKWRRIGLDFIPIVHEKLFEALPAVCHGKGSIIAAMLEDTDIEDKLITDLYNVEYERSNEDGEYLHQIWNVSDVVAIPHYLLGYARALGIVSFDDALANCSSLEPARVRDFLSTYCMAFDETCTYRGEWLAVPHTVLSKVLFRRGRAERNWESWEQIFLDSQKVGKHPLCEDKVGQVSIWYEWQMILAASNAKIFLRQMGEDLPEISPDCIELEKHIRNGAFDRISANPLFSAFNNFRSLVASQGVEEQGNTGWFDAQSRFLGDISGERYLCFSGWSDSVGELLGERSGEERIAVQAIPHFRSSNGRGAAPQSLDGWVFVIPDRAERRKNRPHLPHRYSKKSINVSSEDIARLMLATLRRDWQRQFHEKSGCSPLRTVFNRSILADVKKQRQILTDVKALEVDRVGSLIQKSIYESKAKGKTTYEYLRMRAEMTLLTVICYTLGEEGRYSAVSDDEMRRRFIIMFPRFLQTLRWIQDIEEKIEG